MKSGGYKNPYLMIPSQAKSLDGQCSCLDLTYVWNEDYYNWYNMFISKNNLHRKISTMFSFIMI